MTSRKSIALTAIIMMLAGCNEPIVDTEVEPTALITISALPAALLPGATVQLLARTLGPNGRVLTDRNITWSSGEAHNLWDSDPVWRR